MGRKMIWIISVAVVVLFLVSGILIGTKKISITPLLARGYELQGVDVSHYQGEIDWNRIEEQGFDNYPLWKRNVYFSPNIDMREKWAMWQYSDTAKLEGYEGEEPFIDQDVYSGTVQEWKDKMYLSFPDDRNEFSDTP